MAYDRLFTIPFTAPFLPHFVKALLQGRVVAGLDASSPAEAMANITLFVPTQRAAKALKQEFLYQIETEASLLPRIITLGAIEDSPNVLIENANLQWIETILTIPPAIPKHHRLLLLARLIRAWAMNIVKEDSENQSQDKSNDVDIQRIFGQSHANA